MMTVIMTPLNQTPRLMTTGAVPLLSLNATAVVKNNKMFVLGGRDRNASADRDVDNHLDKGHDHTHI